ncbi:uncharacterized protein PHACADRAFT_201930 [Phanerochaete carnosa HHB-10118-sp]|uniref:Uncharacterized protein n=1 Tax=Phanerochaete carnosa (strain HHB-10118-sp) TaxID=650164 RepID=K5VDH1_PHACS|nr:uncharacterized protein PHACADRAFT_201930 [Phanerochaete carnosa HHB-10118-sp]EKM49178.1 hypothetical protein PHACADRAFT_201930 [Phanerochaete carnosa HHB-10118-sp]
MKNSQDDYSTSNWGTTTTDTTKDIGDVVFNNFAPTDTTHIKEQYEYHKDSSSATQHKKNSFEKGTGLTKKPGLEKNKPNKQLNYPLAYHRPDHRHHTHTINLADIAEHPAGQKPLPLSK